MQRETTVNTNHGLQARISDLGLLAPDNHWSQPTSYGVSKSPWFSVMPESTHVFFSLPHHSPQRQGSSWRVRDRRTSETNKHHLHVRDRRTQFARHRSTPPHVNPFLSRPYGFEALLTCHFCRGQQLHIVGGRFTNANGSLVSPRVPFNEWRPGRETCVFVLL